MAQMKCSDIEKIRNKMGLNQAGFARLLGATAMSVSRWEREVNCVPSRQLLALELLARDVGVDGWTFWKLAGLAREDARSMLGRVRARTIAANRC